MKCPKCGNAKEFWIEAWSSLLFKDGIEHNPDDMPEDHIFVCPTCKSEVHSDTLHEIKE